MVMTFVLMPLSHYNTIIEPCAHFLFSILEGLSIVSMLDIYQDTAICDKLIFSSAIKHILTHAHVSIPSSHLFPMMGAISNESLVKSFAQLVVETKWPRQEFAPTK